jgi:hypothetical protein
MFFKTVDFFDIFTILQLEKLGWLLQDLGICFGSSNSMCTLACAANKWNMVSWGNGVPFNYYINQRLQQIPPFRNCR